MYKRNLSLLTLGITIVAVALLIFLSGCVKSPNPINDTQVNDNGSTTEGIIAVVNANNQFAFDLYSQFKDKDKNVNLFFSPYSISSALAMTYEGARSQTAEEMQNVLHIPKDADLRRANSAKIINEINRKDKEYNLSVANALWAQKNFTFIDAYFNVVNSYYGGKVTNLDFEKDTENSRITINNWVEIKTNDKIKDLIPNGVLKPATRLVLTNAIYLKANWSSQFKSENTGDGQFKLSSGINTNVKMMHQTSNFNYGETSDLQILEMNYIGNDLSMLVILPKNNNLNNLENSFSKEKLDEWKKGMKNEKVAVTLPKFNFETKYLMSNDLKEMGMPTAFTDSADFSGMTGQRDLKISEVIHQTFVNVSESGTEAAAATAVIMEVTSIPYPIEEPKVFTADHPFIFIIQQKDTGNILFLGRVSDPSR